MNVNGALDVLDRMRLPNGAYTASVSDDYNYVWIRDVVYTVIPFINDPSNRYEKAYHALFDLFQPYEWKIDISYGTENPSFYLNISMHGIPLSLKNCPMSGAMPKMMQ